MASTTRTIVTIGTSICVLLAACSTASSPNSGASGSDPTPDGTTPTTNPGLVGCGGETEPPGCFATVGGKPYTPPATATCEHSGRPASGKADTHCNGVTLQTVNAAACSVTDAGAPADAGTGDAATNADAGAAPAPGLCGENGPDYGATMYGTEGDDDDCKYHTSYSVTPICENDGTYFTVKANYLTRNNAPLTDACTFAELCLNDTHPAPAVDARPAQGSPGQQQVVEGPPGTYTIGPVVFDAPGMWTVRFHFNEICCDVVNDSPHGHAAYLVNIP